MAARQRQRRSNEKSRSSARRSASGKPSSRRTAKTKPARRVAKAKPSRPPAAREKEAPHLQSPTAVAAEALRTGVSPKQSPRHKEESSREDEKMRVGDPDDSAMKNEYSGEDTPGGSTPTPDQNDVDEIGRAYGLQDEDSGALRSSSEVLDKRDKRRSELRPPRRPQA